MLVSQSTNTKGLISAILGNAEIASLGRAPSHRPIMKIAEMADARKWFLDMDESEWGGCNNDGTLAGFGAGFCINWCRNNRNEYMYELVREWMLVDDEIAKKINSIRRGKLGTRSFNKRGRFSKSGREITFVQFRDKQADKICDYATRIMNECKEKYYG